MKIGTEDRPLRIAIIGSGPSGFYAADALFAIPDLSVHVDMYDRLPTPYGLVRGGVAPDHQKIKNVVKVYERSADRPNFRFFGNVRLGTDIQVDDLKTFYDQIIYAVGNEGDRRLGIPGEYAVNCAPSAVFVGWYNGHPDYQSAQFNFEGPTAVVMGNGNVAADVARILARDEEELRATDIADNALRQLSQSKVKDIYIIGRGGPANISITPPELTELGKMKIADPVVDPADMVLGIRGQATYDAADPKSATRKGYEILKEYSERPAGNKPRKVHLKFRRAAREVIEDDNGRVRAVKIERLNYFQDEKGRWRANGTGEFEEIETQLFLTAIGFEGEPIPGVPFNTDWKVIANDDGRVVTYPENERVPNQYVVGWAMSGPKGQIGMHKQMSAGIVKHMIEDFVQGSVEERELPPLLAVDQFLDERGIPHVSFEDWKVIDDVETHRGNRRGAPRVKFTAVEDMLSVVGVRSVLEK